jgi:hypothetical protein
MATNTLSSNTGVAGSGIVTFNVRNAGAYAYVYVTYDVGNGTSAALTIQSLNPGIHATNTFNHSAFATATVAAITITLNAKANHRFQIPLASGETSLIATLAFTGGNSQTCVIDCYPA